MKWLVVALLWGVAVLNYLDRQVIFSLFPLLQQDLHATTFELGLVSTVFLATYGVLSPFAGYLADRLGRVRIIVISLVVWSATTWFTGHVHSMPEMLWSRAVMGISEAFYLPAALALVADWHSSRTRSFATGIHQSGLYTGIVLGGAWGGWMGDKAGWRPVFDILGVVGAVYFVILWILLRGKAAEPNPLDFSRSVRELLRSAGFIPLVLSFAAMAIANWLIYTWLPLFLYERFHMSLTDAGFSATFYLQAASYAGVIAGGILSDRWSRRMRLARIYSQIGSLIFAAPFLVLLSVTNLQPVLIAALVTFGFGRGIFDCNTMPIVREITPAHLSATAYGILNMVGCLAGGIGAAVAGSLKQHLGLPTAFQMAAVVLILGALCLTRITSRRTSSAQPL
jgi:MFS family permease